MFFFFLFSNYSREKFHNEKKEKKVVDRAHTSSMLTLRAHRSNYFLFLEADFFFSWDFKSFSTTRAISQLGKWGERPEPLVERFLFTIALSQKFAPEKPLKGYRKTHQVCSGLMSVSCSRPWVSWTCQLSRQSVLESDDIKQHTISC